MLLTQGGSGGILKRPFEKRHALIANDESIAVGFSSDQEIRK